ncbi:hypothetical protein [Streptomyces sp. NRRL F-525]|uniref:hypothetical protein n=1 Tax=Streptomyces sp. NRRL F-525 TaxID=1463861 RepID=UPI000525A7CD|nr:hypothetical protein [Streptomyces sp. NRRL F-525]
MNTAPVTEADLIEAVRIQLCTWATSNTGVAIPETVATTAELRDLVRHFVETAEEEWAEFDDDDTHRGLAHLINAEAEVTWAAHGRGDRHILAALISLVLAAPALS